MRWLAELELERRLLAPELETVFLGGGTPTFTEPAALERLLESLPPACEVRSRQNPETVTQGLARMLRSHGVDPSLPRRAELPAAPARRSRTCLSNPTPSGVPSTTFVTPDSTTSPSTSSTGSRPDRRRSGGRPRRRARAGARAPSRVTSSRRSRGHASPTPTGTSSSARPTRWSPTSSSWSSSCRRRVSLVRDGQLLPRFRARSSFAAQPRLLAGAGLRRAWRGRGFDGCRTPLAEHASPGRIHGGIGARKGARACGRAALTRRAPA